MGEQQNRSSAAESGEIKDDLVEVKIPIGERPHRSYSIPIREYGQELLIFDLEGSLPNEDDQITAWFVRKTGNDEAHWQRNEVAMRVGETASSFGIHATLVSVDDVIDGKALATLRLSVDPSDSWLADSARKPPPSVAPTD